MRILTTILQADGGSARVLGHDVAKEAGLVRSLIGLAGQYAAVDENLTGRENLEMVGQPQPPAPVRRSTDRAGELLDQFDLADAGDRTLKTYSGGMRRRLDLAAALVARPTVLFLDEPTTGLDPQSRNDLWEVIEQLVEGGTTVLLTTQYLEEADRLANTLVVLDHGRVIAEGTPAQLKANLGATVLEVGLARIEDAQRTAGLLGALGPHAPTVNGTVVEVTVDDGPEAAMASLRSLDQAGHRPGRLHPAGAQPRRRLPGPHRPPGRGTRTGRTDEDDGGRTTAGAGERPRHGGHAGGTGRARHDHRHRRPHRLRSAPLDRVGIRLRWAVSDTLHHHQAQHPQLHPHPRGAVLLDGAADHVRAAVPLCVRRRHPRPRAPATSTT